MMAETSIEELGRHALLIIAAAEHVGLRIDDSNVIDLLADNISAPLQDLRTALVTAGLGQRFPKATSDSQNIEYGTCGRDGCRGLLEFRQAIPATREDPGEPAAWECPRCGQFRPHDPFTGEINYSDD